MAVHEQKNAHVVIAGTGKAAHADVAVIAVVGDIEGAHATQNVGQSAVAVLLNLIGRDYRHQGGSRLAALQILRSGDDLYVHQLLERRLRKIRSLRPCSRPSEEQAHSPGKDMYQLHESGSAQAACLT